ncbi:MAG: hypothetical protein R3236_09330, partial [Phycisphaeraceae bacterium]|nr:hypothetical protein [Phycisphaeraceae bacterium]
MNIPTDTRPHRRLAAGLLGLLLAAWLCPPASADKVQELFDSLFAERIRKATATFNKDDDVALAREMVQAARESAEHKKLAALLAQNAYDLARKTPQGYDTAIEALRLHTAAEPEKAAENRQKEVFLRGRQYSRPQKAEEKTRSANAYIDALTAAARAEVDDQNMVAALGYQRKAMMVAAAIRSDRKEQISDDYQKLILLKKVNDQLKRLLAAVKEDPKDVASATRLINLYTETEQVDKARKYTFLVPDKRLQKNVSLAAADEVEKLSAEDALALGDWYMAFAKDPNAKMKAAMYRRAYRYYRRYLATGDAKGLNQTKARIALKQIADAMKLLGEELPKAVAAKAPVPSTVGPATGNVAPPSTSATWLKDAVVGHGFEKRSAKGHYVNRVLPNPLGSSKKLFPALGINVPEALDGKIGRGVSVLGTEQSRLVIP